MHYKIIWDKNSIWIKCFPFPSQVIYWQWIDTKELESFSFDWGCVHISGNSQGPNQSNLYFQNSLSSFYSGKVRLAIQNLSHLSTHPSRLFSSLFSSLCMLRKYVSKENRLTSAGMSRLTGIGVSQHSWLALSPVILFVQTHQTCSACSYPRPEDREH